jgi:hypothetical protein
MPLIDETKAEARYTDVFLKRVEFMKQTGLWPDISDSKKSFELVWEFATEIYRMFPYFIEEVTDNGTNLLYSTKFQKFPFSVCYAFSPNFNVNVDACNELKYYVNFLYFQIQQKKRPPKS